MTNILLKTIKRGSCSYQTTNMRCIKSLSLSNIKTYSPFNIKKYNKDLVYEDNYSKKSRKSFLDRTVDSVTGNDHNNLK